jgi:hypothetical protein
MRWPSLSCLIEDRARPGTIERYGNVLATTYPDEVLEELDQGHHQYSIDLCERCSRLDECDEYESQAEAAAENMRLLSGYWSGSHWAWVAPKSVIDLSRVVVDSNRSDELQELMAAKRRRMPLSIDGVRSFFLDVLQEENRHLRELAKGAKKRLRRKVKDSVGSAAAVLVEEAFDAATDIGAKRLREAFQQAAWKPKGRPEASGAAQEPPKPVDPLKEAEDLLDLRWPYSKEDLEVSFRIKVKKYHPDVAGNSGTEKMAKINIARDTIKKAREW